MKVLIAGANGYIGTRLLLLLAERGHEIYALVRSRFRFEVPEAFQKQIYVIEGDLLKPESLRQIPKEMDAAYYLVHSMSYSERFQELEALSAKNFVEAIQKTDVKQIIYLSGLVNDQKLSKHLSSRKKVGEILRGGKIPVTTLMAGIIIGSGSASFEIIRDLVEKLPIMIAPRWLKSKTQPIAVRDVLEYLIGALGNEECLGQSFDVGGPDVMSYKDLLLRFAKVRGLKRVIIPVPVLTPRLSSYWLYFVTTTSFSLARYLVDSLVNDAVCKENRITEVLPRKLLSYEEALKIAFSRIEEDWVPSSWKDSLNTSRLNADLSVYMQVPRYGILSDVQMIDFEKSVSDVQKEIWSLGGKKGWLVMNWAWKIRGHIDKLFGGTGLRRGRTHPTKLKPGDALDFWRVLVADEAHHRLVLYAEMKLPGEAWLEFKIEAPDANSGTLCQVATFRPKGVLGRLYWYAMYPFHLFIFKRMAKKIVFGSK